MSPVGPFDRLLQKGGLEVGGNKVKDIKLKSLS